MLQLGPPTQWDQDFNWFDWETDGLSLNKVRNMLLSDSFEVLGIRNVPNRRVSGSVLVQSWLQKEEEVSVGQARQDFLMDHASGVDPESLWKLESEIPYTVALSWKSGGVNGTFDVLFQKKSLRKQVDFPAPPLHTEHQHSNRAFAQMDHYVEAQIRNFLKDKLPEYMVPSAFVVLEQMPVTPNGKLDRRALPDPMQRTRMLQANYVAPRSPEEKFLCEIWAEILRLDRIGINDNFLELR